MNPDKLTRAERIRLSAFAEISRRHGYRAITMETHMTEAEALERWLYAAREPMPLKGPQPITTAQGGK